MRTHNQRFGALGERIAARWLARRGWRIVYHRFVNGRRDIDLVAERDGVVAFVEVKARPSLDQAAQAVTGDKARRMSRAARAWAARHPWSADKVLRGDALLMAPRRWPRHAPGAVELEL